MHARSVYKRLSIVLAITFAGCGILNAIRVASRLGSKIRSLAKNQNQHHFRPSLLKRKPSFRILCTTGAYQIMKWGSYKIRCRDFRRFASKYAPDVEVDAISLSEASRRHVVYNATLVVKSVVAYRPWLGRVFVDVVDSGTIKDGAIPSGYEVVLQSPAQTSAYSKHVTHVIDHWYNSFAADYRDDDIVIPLVEPVETLRIATVWNPRRIDKGCLPLANVTGVTYDCIEKEFEIESWFQQYVNVTDDEVNSIVKNPEYGPGMLYHTLFRKYHVLVLYAKADSGKLQYGNVQRIVSQMRSGVPVLIEARGNVFLNFINRYSYRCIFARNSEEFDKFEVAIEKMKAPQVRKECQQQAVQIVKDYSPRAKVEQFLRAFGYKGSLVTPDPTVH